MGMIKPDRHELFAQGLAAGLTQESAYVEAGYKPSRPAASRLATNINIINRVAELNGRKVARLQLTKQYLIDAAMENLEKALGRKPVKITRHVKVGEDEWEDIEQEVYIYKGDVANQSLKLLGSELGLFTERKDVRITNEYSNLSDAELAQRLVEVGRQMLEVPVIEHQEDEGEE